MTSADDRDDRATQTPGFAGAAAGLLTREASRVPLIALTLGLQAWERTRPLRELAVRRGSEALQIAAHTPLGRFLPQPELDDDAQAEAEKIAAGAARETAEKARATIETARRETPQPPAGPAKAAKRPTSTKPAAPAKSTPSTRASRPATGTAAGQVAASSSEEAVEAGAPGVATERVEQVTEQLDLAEPTSREDLPIADFDNISLGSLRGRLRSLSLEQLVTLREWEKAHAHRLPVVTLLDNRIAKVSVEQGETYPDEPAAGATGPTGSTGSAGSTSSTSSAGSTRSTSSSAAPAASGSRTGTPPRGQGKAAAAGAAKAAKDEGGTLRV